MEKEEKLFLTVKQCRHLQELGLNMDDAIFGWYPKQIDRTENGSPIYSEKEYTIEKRADDNSYNIPTYTLQEALSNLPYGRSWDTWQWQITFNGKSMEYNDGDGYSPHRENGSENILKKTYNMLCWAAKRGYIKKKTK